MKLQEFISKIQAYYGMSYPQGQRDAVVTYLGAKQPELLDALFEVCLKRFSSKWKMVPDIAIFEEHLGEALDLARDRQRKLEFNRPRQIQERSLTPEELAEHTKRLRKMIDEVERKKRFEPAKGQGR